MNIINWNVRGLEKSKRTRLVRDILLEHKINLVGLQEIKKI
jgi:exonuclease III